jgi:hypothetical protein
MVPGRVGNIVSGKKAFVCMNDGVSDTEYEYGT